MRVNSSTEMLALGKVIGKDLRDSTVIELVGDVGVGKTTFTRGLAQGLGIDSELTSPSFTISKRYFSPQNSLELVHYDFYRLDDPGIMRAELTEAINSPRTIAVIEWGDDVANLLPEDKIRLDFRLNPDGSRQVTATGISSDLWKTYEKQLPNCVKPVENSLDSVQKPNKSVENHQRIVEKVDKNVYKTQETCGKPVKNSQQSPDDSAAPSHTTSSQPHSIHLYLDTSTDTCVLRLNDHEYTRQGRYDLAENIFTFIHEKLQANQADWSDISKITFFSGPGSFTGLRIGAAVVNALADQLDIPLFDHHGRKHQIILPEYGREANISAPRK